MVILFYFHSPCQIGLMGIKCLSVSFSGLYLKLVLTTMQCITNTYVLSSSGSSSARGIRFTAYVLKHCCDNYCIVIGDWKFFEPAEVIRCKDREKNQNLGLLRTGHCINQGPLDKWMEHSFQMSLLGCHRGLEILPTEVIRCKDREKSRTWDFDWSFSQHNPYQRSYVMLCPMNNLTEKNHFSC